MEKDNINAASIESIVGTQEQQNNLLFYNFNAYEATNNATQKRSEFESGNRRRLVSQSSKRSMSRASLENSRQLQSSHDSDKQL